MEKYMASLVIITIIIALTVLVAVGKIDPVYLATIVSGVIGWLIPTPPKPTEPPVVAPEATK